MASRISIDTTTIDWQPAHEVLPGYLFDGAGPDHGAFVKVLRRPDDGGGCWHLLLRFSAPDGKALRITATAASDEEVFILTDTSGQDRAGSYGCNPEGLRHGQTVIGELVALVHYHGAPDDIIRTEVVDLTDLSS